MSLLLAGVMGALIASLLIGVYAHVWRGWLATPPACQRAQLFNAHGLLDSVRTVTGPPPAVITCRAGEYRIDRAAAGDHLVYRQTV